MFFLEAVISGISFGVSALLVGTLMIAGLVLPRGEPDTIRRALFLSSLALILVFLLIASVSLLMQGARLQGGELPSLDTLIRYLLRTQSGKVWLWREFYGVLLLAGGFLVLRDVDAVRASRMLLILALPLVACRSLMSHASAVRENTAITVAADAIHLIATALWAGGLPVLLWALFQCLERLNSPLFWAAEVVARFSTVALVSVAVLVLTGLYQSWIHVQTPAALWGTSYGRVLLLKLSFFLAMIGVGALNFLSTRPNLLQAAQSNRDDALIGKKTLSRVGTEGLLGILILSVTGFLTSLPPATHSLHAQHQAASAAARPLAAEGAGVAILTPKRGQVFRGDQVPVQFTMTRGKRGLHVHAYVDGELRDMFKSENGMLTGIRPGRHMLELRVVADDHQTELDASDRTDFVVQ